MSDADQNRKLASIVAVDVAGYSARTEIDDAKTAREIASLREVIDAIAQSHSGRVFNTAGDGFMLEFPSTRLAVEAALALARTCVPAVRVGVHLGDVAVQPNGDLLGHGVNVAARLMARAAPGSALVSADVRRTIHGPLALELHSQGVLKLDKMAESLEAFSTSAAAVASRPASLLSARRHLPVIGACAALALLLFIASSALVHRQQSPGSQTIDRSREPFVVVACFDNLTGKPDFDYFPKGLVVNIQSTLASSLNGVKVAGVATGRQFCGEKKSPAHVRDTIKATHIVDGSVQLDGGNLHILAEIIETKDGGTLWSETFDRSMENALDVQGFVARRLAGILKVATPNLAQVQSMPSTAVENYLRATEMFADSVSSAPRALRAVQLLEQTTAAAPNFAPGWAALADAYRKLNYRQSDDLLDSTAKKGRDAAHRALALDPSLGHVHAVLGRLEPEWNWQARMAHLRRALALSPYNDTVLRFQSAMASVTGLTHEAERLHNFRLSLDPFIEGEGAKSMRDLFSGQDRLAAEEALRRLVAQNPTRYAMTWLSYFEDRLNAWDLAGARRAGDEIKKNISSLRDTFNWSDANVLEIKNGLVDENIKSMEQWPPSKSTADGWVKTALADLSKRSRGQECAAHRLGDFALPFAQHGYGRTDIAFEVAEELFLRRGYVGAVETCDGTPVFLDRQARTDVLFEPNLASMRQDTRIWRIFGAVGLAQYWLDSGQWPDFCSEEKLPYDCRVEAARVAHASGAAPAK